MNQRSHGLGYVYSRPNSILSQTFPKGNAMKRICLIVFLIAIPCLLLAQQQVRTEATNNRTKFYSAATTGDTVFKKAAYVAGTNTPQAYCAIVGALDGILVGSPVASDTIIVKNGLGTVLQIIIPASNAIPTYWSLETRLDTSLIFIQKKTSATTLFWRPNY